MADPSLTLARRLYAEKHGLRAMHVCASIRNDGPFWVAVVSFGLRPAVWATNGTERAAVRALCRALGWRP